MTARTVLTPRLRGAGERRRQLGFAGAALAAAVVAGAAPTVAPTGMPQTVTAAALLLAVVAARISSRTAGLVALWALWLLAPGIRRVLGMAGPYLSTDPLALVPFLATVAVATMELARVPLPSRVRRLLALAALGYLIGVPVGLLTAPASAAFALLAYGGALLAFVVGFADDRLSVTRTLLLLMPALSGYAVYQYFAGLPPWDETWLASVDFITTGAPEEGRIRVFSTLNSPGTFAAVLGLALCGYLALPAVRARWLAGAGAAVVALTLTYVRSAWLALMAAAVVYVLLTRGRGAGRVATAAVACVVLVLALGAVSSGTADAISERFTTLGSLEQDRSANDRVNLRLSLVPEAASAPLGHGLGQAGEATRLGAASRLLHADNGYLALLYQVGAAGFLLVAGAIVAFCAPLLAAVWRDRGRDPTGVFLATALAFLFVLLAAGDVLYGVTGAVFWYLLGRAHRWTAFRVTPHGARDRPVMRR
jgi:putative inorganic carbon (HCO3(-)) transporter